MFSFSLGKFSPIRSFPAYPGPYPVGSCDVELPAAELDSQGTECPDQSISTVAFRVFYPCEPNDKQRPVRWIPNPQIRYGAAYGRFLGANERLSGLLS
jgi:platelet-activating factor acetylhydrolase